MIKFEYSEIKEGEVVKSQIGDYKLPDLVIATYPEYEGAFYLKCEQHSSINWDKVAESTTGDAEKIVTELQNFFRHPDEAMVILGEDELTDIIEDIKKYDSIDVAKDRLFSKDVIKVLEIIKTPLSQYLLELNPYVSEGIKNIHCKRNDPKLYFLPEGKETILNEDRTWNDKGRQSSKVGKLIVKLLPEGKFSKKDVEDFVNDFIGYNSDPDFKFFKGEDIRKYYHERHHASDQTGTLHSSCMRHENCQKYFDIYVKNENVSLMVLMNAANKVIGRALLWETKEGIFMDRVYANDANQKKFVSYAQHKGWMTKYAQNHSTEGQFSSSDGKKKELKLDIPLEHFNFKYYPYMDTLCYLYPDEGVVTNYQKSGVSSGKIVVGTMRNTKGTISWSGGCTCAHCGARHSESYFVQYDGNYYCPTCVETDSKGNIYTQGNGVEYKGEVYSRRSLIRLYSGNWVLKEEAAMCQLTGNTYLIEDLIEIDGKKVHKDKEAEAKFVFLDQQDHLSIEQLIDIMF